MDVTKKEFLALLHRLFPIKDPKDYGQERVITFEINKDELHNNFLQKMFKEEFESNKNEIFLSDSSFTPKENKTPFFTSITIAGQFKIQLKIV